MSRDHRVTLTPSPTTKAAEQIWMDEIFANDLMNEINQNFVLEVEASHFPPITNLE